MIKLTNGVIKRYTKIKITLIILTIVVPFCGIMGFLSMGMAASGGFVQVSGLQKSQGFFTALSDSINKYCENPSNAYTELLAMYVLKYGNIENYDTSKMAEIVNDLKTYSYSDLMNIWDFKSISELFQNSYSELVASYTQNSIQSFYYNCFFPIASEIQAYNPALRQPITISPTYSDDFLDPRNFENISFHDGNDIMCTEGTPIIAVESGYIENLGWNTAGGWRIGIRSKDQKRYWYYAHMRKYTPYHTNYKKGDYVNAGDIIGFVGSTGYSDSLPVDTLPESDLICSKATDGLFVPHLHIGLKVTHLDEKGEEQATWTDPYPILKFLEANKASVKEQFDGDKNYVSIVKPSEQRVFRIKTIGDYK